MLLLLLLQTIKYKLLLLLALVKIKNPITLGDKTGLIPIVPNLLLLLRLIAPGAQVLGGVGLQTGEQPRVLLFRPVRH